MDTSKKIIKGAVNGRGFTITSAITQWDYGWQFIPEIEDLPPTYRLDFSNEEKHGTALPVYCSADGAEVPTELIDTGKDVWVWFVRIGEGYGITEYKWRIPNKCKPKTEQDEPTPSQQSSIDQLIVRSNEAVESAEQSASDADQSAQSASEDAGRAERASDAVKDKAEQIVSNTENISALREDVSGLSSSVSLLERGKSVTDLIEAQKAKGGIYANIRFEEGYTVNSSNGTIGSTPNLRYFATNVALKESAIVIGCEKIIVKCNTDYIARFTYAFFDRDHVLIGSVITINPVVANEFELTVPDGAYYLHCGGYGTTTANTPTACTTTFVYGVTSFFVGKLDEQLTSETLPAQGKATGTRISALEALKDTTGLNKLRVIPNANNVNFVARTGLTNLFVGYGAGANNVEDYPNGTMNNLNTYDGSFNVAVGFEAMNANVGGDHCTAVGYTALKQNINGDYNTCMGEDALYNNQYGSYNVAIGDHALMSNEGDSNIAIGASVARSITGVDDSVMIGSYAGVNMSGSKHNIAIGNRSGVESGVTHGCIVIGNDAKATADKQIVIGTSVHESVVIAGKRFVTPTVTITPITGGHRITITDADGEHSADVMDGHNGMVTVNVTGTTPTITAQADYRYVCGEVATLDFTPSSTGICDVVFTSGSTPTVVTLPSTIKWANGFDPTALEANTTYELNIMDGLGVACAWT